MITKKHSNIYSRSYILHDGKLVVEFNRDYHAVLVWRNGNIVGTMQIQTLALEGRGRMNSKGGYVFHQTVAELIKLYD